MIRALTQHDTPRSQIDLRKVRSGDYRLTFQDARETAAYYTDNFEDAVNTAVEMDRKRAL